MVNSKKKQGRPKNSGYSEAGASWAKRALKAMVPNSLSPQSDIDFNNTTLRQRSRMLYMGAPIATSAIKTSRTNIVGTGLRLKSSIDREALGITEEQAAAWQRRTEAEFALWANDKRACDANGCNNFYGLQQLACMSWLMSGDVFALRKHVEPTDIMPYTLRLQMVEADRIRTPQAQGTISGNATIGRAENGNMIFDGVEVDGNGRIVAYHIANTYPFDIVSVNFEPERFERIEAYGALTGLPNVLHVFDSERPDQYRGVPMLAAAIEPLLQLRRFTEAEIAAAVIQSFFSAFVKTETDPSQMPFNDTGENDGNGVERAPNEYQMGPGTINVMEPGEDITFGQPTHPQGTFEPFVRAMCEQIGGALEIPADMLRKSYNTSYSAARAAIMDAWKMFRMRREWLVDDFCRPAYEMWMHEAVALGRISAPGFFTDPVRRRAYLGSNWIGPSAGMLDPLKEVNAAAKAIETGLTSRADESMKLNGSQYEQNVTRLKIENAQLLEATGGKENANAQLLETQNAALGV